MQLDKVTNEIRRNMLAGLAITNAQILLHEI